MGIFTGSEAVQNYLSPTLPSGTLERKKRKGRKEKSKANVSSLMLFDGFQHLTSGVKETTKPEQSFRTENRNLNHYTLSSTVIHKL
jgi:hypothetical protein